MPRTIALLFLLVVGAAPAAGQASAIERLRSLPPIEADEVVWLARAVYSESDRDYEQRLVAWVIRNRVETGFRGSTYREVVLEPRQFSAFNAPSRRRSYIMGLDANSTGPAWLTALGIALDVYGASDHERPFSTDTRHFYSPVSMVGTDAPHWADAGRELDSFSLGVDPERFRFIAGVDESIAQSDAMPVSRGVSTRIEAMRPQRPTVQSRRRRFSGTVTRPRSPVLRTRKRQ